MKNKKDKNKLSSTQIMFKTLKYFFPVAWNYKKGYVPLFTLNSLLCAIQPFINLYFLPIIINELIKGSRADFKLTMTYAIIMVVSNAFVNFLISFSDLTLQKFQNSFEVWASTTSSEKCMSMDFYLTEDKQALDQIEKAKQGMSWYSGGIHGIISTFFTIVNNVIKLLGVVVLILFNAPWLILIISIVVILRALAQKKLNQIQFEGYKDLSRTNRIFGYFLFNIISFNNAKDFKLYSAKDLLLSKCDFSIKELLKSWKKQADCNMPLNHFQSFVSAVSDFPKYVYIGILALTKVISIGTFQQMFSACGVFNQALDTIVSSF